MGHQMYLLHPVALVPRWSLQWIQLCGGLSRVATLMLVEETNGLYKPLYVEIAIENGHWNSGFSHEKWWYLISTYDFSTYFSMSLFHYTLETRHQRQFNVMSVAESHHILLVQAVHAVAGTCPCGLPRRIIREMLSPLVDWGWWTHPYFFCFLMTEGFKHSGFGLFGHVFSRQW